MQVVSLPSSSFFSPDNHWKRNWNWRTHETRSWCADLFIIQLDKLCYPLNVFRPHGAKGNSNDRHKRDRRTLVGNSTVCAVCSVCVRRLKISPMNLWSSSSKLVMLLPLFNMSEQSTFLPLSLSRTHTETRTQSLFALMFLHHLLQWAEKTRDKQR